MQELKLRGTALESDGSDFLCLDDIWKAARRPKGRSPVAWRGGKDIQDLQIALYERLYGATGTYQFSRIIKQVSFKGSEKLCVLLRR